MNKKISALIMSALMLSAISFTGCGNKNEDVSSAGEKTQVTDTATKEIRQNDYRGGVIRTYALQENILSVMESMKQNNVTIRSDSPNSFWTNEGYQDFVVNFLNSPIMNDTQWFNEEETDWATITSQLISVNNSFTVPSSDSPTGYAAKYSSLLASRNEKDDYTISGISGNWNGKNTYFGNTTYRILYDCDKDWCKAYASLDINSEVPNITTDLFEYARINDNTFAIQTSTERLLVVLDIAETDTDIRERSIKEFYYSKLTSEGARTTFAPFEPKLEYDEITGGYITENARYNSMMETYSLINEKGDLTTQYGVNDSMFLTDNITENINSEWVFDDKSLQQAIIYKNGALVVTTYNKLSETYERFIYVKDGINDEDIKKLENMVEIKNLVGVQKVPKAVVKPAPVVETTTENETAEPETSEESDTENETEEVTEPASQSDADRERELLDSLNDGDVLHVTE